jgi:6-phosphogluconolactonase
MRQRYEWCGCRSDVELARVVADRWLRRSGHRRSCVALSGGRITRSFFDAVVERVGNGNRGLESTEFFWADERCVPAEHPESNFRLAKKHLLDPLGVESQRIHRLAGELDPEQAARLGEVELRQFAAAEMNGQPVLDLVFLGMGEDGHVASLFPGHSEAVVERPSAYLAVIGPKPPPRRLTLSYGVLAEATEVWVLISGSGKEKALASSLSGEEQTPLARVIRSRQNTLIFSDLRLEARLEA